jgi:ribosomal protein L11 methylase PrmA
VLSILDSDSVSKFREFTIVSKCGGDSTFTYKVNNEIHLQDTKSGWGDGRHPTTNLCLQFVYDNVMTGDIIMGNKSSYLVKFVGQFY